MRPLRQLGFLTIGLFDPDDPREGHESTLDIIALAERLGFDSAWVHGRRWCARYRFVQRKIEVLH